MTAPRPAQDQPTGSLPTAGPTAPFTAPGPDAPASGADLEVWLSQPPDYLAPSLALAGQAGVCAARFVGWHRERASVALRECDERKHGSDVAHLLQQGPVRDPGLAGAPEPLLWPLDEDALDEALAVFGQDSGNRGALIGPARDQVQLLRDRPAVLRAAGRAGVPTPTWRLASTTTELMAALEEFNESGARVCLRSSARGPQAGATSPGFRVVTTHMPTLDDLSGSRGPGVSLAELLMAFGDHEGDGSDPDPLLLTSYLPDEHVTVHVVADAHARAAACVPVFSETPAPTAAGSVFGSARVRWVPGHRLWGAGQLPRAEEVTGEPEQVVARAVASWAAHLVSEMSLPGLTSVSFRAGRGQGSGWALTSVSCTPTPTVAAAAAAGMDLIGGVVALAAGHEHRTVSQKMCTGSPSGRTVRQVSSFVAA